MVTKTPEELAALSPVEMKEYLADEEKTVFGRTVINEPAYKKVKGVPVELGIGAPGRETANHFNAIRKYEGEEAYSKAVADAGKRKAG